MLFNLAWAQTIVGQVNNWSHQFRAISDTLIYYMGNYFWWAGWVVWEDWTISWQSLQSFMIMISFISSLNSINLVCSHLSLSWIILICSKIVHHWTSAGVWRLASVLKIKLISSEVHWKSVSRIFKSPNPILDYQCNPIKQSYHSDHST